MSCEIECCDQPKLCVDAQFFVPKNTCPCFATAILFSSNNAGATIADADAPATLETAVGDYTACYGINWGSPSVKIGDLKLSYTTTSSGGHKWDCDLIDKIVGVNIVNTTSIPLQSRFEIDPDCNVDMVCFESYLSAEYDCIKDNTKITVKLANKNIVCFSIDPADGGPVANKDLVASNATDFILLDGIPQSIVNTSGIPSGDDATYEQCVGEACLCLQLRANKNTLIANEANNNTLATIPEFPDGKYDVCISYKPCATLVDNGNGDNSVSADWENAHVFRIFKDGENLTGTWGKDTNKDGLPIGCPGDHAKLLGIADVSTCGKLQNVMNNDDDFVVCISNVMQTFSLFGIDKSTSLIRTTTNLTVKPFVSKNTKINKKNKWYKAQLANTKLYVSLKYVCIVPVSGTDVQEKTSYAPYQCCPGTLNPYEKLITRKASNGESVKYRQIKGFTNKEITHMQDHPLHGSGVSRECTLCMYNPCIDAADANVPTTP